MDQEEDIRNKISLLESDRKAYYESSQAAMKDNKARITALRNENKELTLKIKNMKAPSVSKFVVGAGGAADEKSVALFDQKICEMIKKHNELRHQTIAKQKQLDQLQQKQGIVQVEMERTVKASQTSDEPQKVRVLENQLDKATIKSQEAQQLHNTYQAIIDKLQQDRLNFDNQIADLEKIIAQKDGDIVNYQTLYSDALLTRDAKLKELEKLEAEYTASKQTREKEKKSLDNLTEERRRQYDAMEKRMRNTFHNDALGLADVGPSDEVKAKIVTYEDAMRRIKDTIGVTDLEEIVSRFETQGETQAHLEALKASHLKTVTALRQEHADLVKQYEAMKYSGEAKNTSNQRMLKEFEAHLNDAESRLRANDITSSRISKILVDVRAAIDHLFDKVESIKAVQFRQASNPVDKLKEAELRLSNVYAEITSRNAELEDAALSNLHTVVLPAHNTRVVFPKLPTTDDESEQEEEEEELISRDHVKRQAKLLVDSKTKKKKRDDD